MASSDNRNRPARREGTAAASAPSRRARSASDAAEGRGAQARKAPSAAGASARTRGASSASTRSSQPRSQHGATASQRSSAPARVASSRKGAAAAARPERSASQSRPTRASRAASSSSSGRQAPRRTSSHAAQRRSPKGKRIAALLVAVVLLLGIGTAADHVLNREKIYDGVFVGAVDVSGKTIAEAQGLIEAHYAEKLASTRAIIYAREDLVGTVDVDTALLQEEAVAEQVSVETARANKQIWVADAASLGAAVDSRELAQEAYAVGREDGGLLSRLGAKVFDRTLAVRCSYDEALLTALADDIDLTLGAPRIDGNIVIEEGAAVVVAGQDGNCIDRDAFTLELDAALLTSEGTDAALVAKVAPMASRINADQAQAAADYVNGILSTELSFVYEGEGWGVSKNALARWISTAVVQKGRDWVLDVRIDEEAAKPGIVAFANEFVSGRDVTVDFETSGASISVLTDGKLELPHVDQALTAVDEALFGPYRELIGLSHDASLTQGSYVDLGQGIVQVTIQKGTAPKEMTFGEALAAGVVMEVGSYTTEYNNNESTQNRVHNIHLAADLITDGVIQSGGGTWSFNDRAGYCDASRGFLGAGVIIEDEVQDAVGGGICQVATTVFNAVYEAGYGIDTRYNHSLYLDAYPAGRDAAVSYPDLDLVWRNDTNSDVLMRVTYTDSSITVTLFGVDPGYEVAHRDGEWRKTKDHATKKVVDETLYAGQSYVETEGADAMQFAVFRTVTDKQGAVVYDDAFYSSYGSVTEVIRVAPGEDVDEKGEEGPDNSTA